MADKKVDRRVKYTKEVLKNSLTDLLWEKPLEKITVKELCEKADVNRGTFYSHYSDQFDLFEEIVENFVVEAVGITEHFFEIEGGSQIKRAAKIYTFVKENHRLTKVLLDGRSIFGFDEYSDKFNEIVHRVYLDDIKSKVENERFVDMVYQYVAAANITLIKYWVNTGMKESENEMAKLALNLTANGVRGLYNENNGFS